MQRRSERTLLCLEPMLQDLLIAHQTKSECLTPSEYVRKLLIEKFREDGTLTQEMFNKMFI
jgi:hypothetical protein